MKKAFAAIVSIMLVLCLVSCSGNTQPDTTAASVSENTTQEIVPDVWATQNQNHGYCGVPLLSAVTTADFGFKILKNSLSQQANALVSPVSILTALSMTANGASGKTLEEMETAMGADMNTLNKIFSENSFNSEGVKTANSVWFKNTDDSLVINDTFVNTVQNTYGAEWYGKKFDKSTVRDINRWVRQKTDGAVKNALSDIPPDAVVYLINTVLFDAEWEYPYDKNDVIKNQIFTAENGEKQKVTMLKSRTNSWMKFGIGRAEGIVRRYKNGYSFAAIMPLEGVSINAALDSFTGTDFAKAVQPIATDPTCGTGLYPIDLYLPKFEFECKLSLADPLKNMGMNTAFSQENADFSKMGTYYGGNIYMGEVYHNTYIKLDELGTKAGAATVIEMNAESAMPVEVETIKFDRPFIYVIYETDTGTPLFVGTVRNFDA